MTIEELATIPILRAEIDISCWSLLLIIPTQLQFGLLRGWVVVFFVARYGEAVEVVWEEIAFGGSKGQFWQGH